MNPVVFHIIDLIIAISSILLSYLVWRDRKKVEHNDKIATKLEEVVEDIATIKSDHKVLEERVNNEVKSLDKVSDKLDDIISRI